jgi:hypothetical protein
VLKLWTTISQIGKENLKQGADARQLFLLNRIASIAALVLLSFIPVSVVLKVPEMTFSVFVGVVCLFLTLLMNHFGKFSLSR